MGVTLVLEAATRLVATAIWLLPPRRRLYAWVLEALRV